MLTLIMAVACQVTEVGSTVGNYTVKGGTGGSSSSTCSSSVCSAHGVHGRKISGMPSGRG
jgi:hypothetical protein